MSVVIRPERMKDFDRIDEINRLAFNDEFEVKLVRNLRASVDFTTDLSLVAQLDEELVGHILFSPIQITGFTPQLALALAPMSVVPKHQDKGIGSALVREGLERARNAGYKAVIVLGHAEYYPRFGFEPASKWRIRPSFKVEDEVFMALEFESGHLQPGIVVYPEVFTP